jgi:ATP-dependent helicase HrpA
VITYPPELPITARRADIVRAIRSYPAVIISGETGCGKSTQLPKMCLEAGRGRRGRVGCTQPRRIAAITIASRIAEETGEPLGRGVGYKIRFDDATSRETRIKVLTDGMLLAETQSDPSLLEYDTLIIDEAHERSLNIDFLLGIVRTVQAVRPELKLIITSATLDIEKFRRAFEGAPVLEVGGRMYPVEVEYRPPEAEDTDEGEADYIESTVKAVDALRREREPGDILVFMPTEQDILETCEILEGRRYPGVSVLPLYARLPSAGQALIYSVAGPKIVVATNVAETSLTIPGIRYVVDTGLARIAQYLPGSRINSLPIRPVSQSSADQRTGRCGRVQAGVCVRLYSEDDYARRARFTPPEILRSNLAGVILRMIDLRLGSPLKFPFVDRPQPKNVEDGYETLFELGALRKKGEEFELTENGRLMARMPLDPRISRMILEARSENCVRETAVIASALSIRDPRERPPDKAAQADATHAPFRHPDSDFLTLLNIWDRYHGGLEGKTSHREKRAFCRDHFLSFPRMREWVFVTNEILDILRDMRIPADGSRETRSPDALYAGVHKAILSGYLSNIAVHKEKNVYAVAKRGEAMIFPGSTLFNRNAAWVVAAEVVRTSRLFARTAARIDPGWLERLGGELCRYNYANPRWENKRGQAVADERVTLFGLEIVSDRVVPYGRIDAEAAHRIFVRSALLTGDVRERFEFLARNLALKARMETVEDKLRRRDILKDEKDLAAFYERRLAGVFDIRGLKDRIRRKNGDTFLRMSEADVLKTVPDECELALFPDEIAFGGVRFTLRYEFLPGDDADGITVEVPADQLSRVSAERLSWGVPGQFQEKVEALIKGLPKRYRKLLVPAADAAGVVAGEMSLSDESLSSALARFVKRRFRCDIPARAWEEADIPKHLKMRLAVTDGQGTVLEAGRDLDALRRARKEAAAVSARDPSVWARARERWERTGETSWVFGTIPEMVALGAGAVAYPGLEPGEKGVNLRLFETAEEAAAAHVKGVEALLLRLFAKDLKFMARHMTLPADYERAALYFGGRDNVERMLLENLKRDVFRKNVRADVEFKTAAGSLVRDLFARAQAIWDAARPVLDADLETHTTLYAIEKLGAANKAVLAVCGEIRAELERLVPKNFLDVYNAERLLAIARYVEALSLRAERAKNDPEKDRAKAAQVKPFADALAELRAALPPRPAAESTAAVEEFRWMVEEFKVAVFAPELKTAFPVSAKRLNAKLREVKALLPAPAPVQRLEKPARKY